MPVPIFATRTTPSHRTTQNPTKKLRIPFRVSHAVLHEPAVRRFRFDPCGLAPQRSAEALTASRLNVSRRAFGESRGRQLQLLDLARWVAPSPCDAGPDGGGEPVGPPLPLPGETVGPPLVRAATRRHRRFA